MIRTHHWVATGAALLCLAGAASAQDGSPTCSDLEFLNIEVHGQHIIRDYLAGGGDWPPSGEALGDALSDNGGPVVVGGPGPGFHFPNGVAPGASFCTGSNSPGAHPGG